MNIACAKRPIAILYRLCAPKTTMVMKSGNALVESSTQYLNGGIPARVSFDVARTAPAVALRKRKQSAGREICAVRVELQHQAP